MKRKHYSLSRAPYPSDLTDDQWAILAPLLPPPRDIGGPRVTQMRELCNAIFYVAREGCRWRAVPHDFGIPWQTVYWYFRRWQADDTWVTIHAALRGQVRQSVGKAATPSAMSTDSQSAKTTAQGGERGYDAWKKINGRKRFVCVDTLGLIWVRRVLPASTQDWDGGRVLFEHILTLGRLFPRLQRIWADHGFANLVAWVVATCTWVLEIVCKTKPHEFEVLPHRWIVERTYAWFGHFRRLSKEYEVLPAVSEAMLDVAMIHLMVRRLTGEQECWSPKRQAVPP